jgi:glycosyltransferase involved in cell wall biosynthesis
LEPDYSNTPVSANRPNYTYCQGGSEARSAPIVSIITSLPAETTFFHETAASILGQSLQDWEWIVAENSTVAKGSQILNQHVRADQRVRAMPCSCETEQESYHQAVRLVRAPLLVIVGCGDLLEPTALEKLWWFLESHPEYAFARGYSVGFGASNSLFKEHIHGTQLVMFQKGAFLDIENGAGDFWLRCADRGYYGGTIPEFLSWRRCADKNALLSRERPAGNLRVWRNGIPPRVSRSSETTIPSNHLGKPKGTRRLLMLAPHLEIGGADKFNLDLITCLQRDHGYEVSVVTTLSSPHRWREYFDRLTPDVFTLHNFLPVEDYPRFILYLIESRRPDTVFIANSRIGYELLPFLRTGSEAPSFVDYLHMEDWSPQGYPNLSLRYAPFLDGTIVSSEYLKRCLIQKGGDPNRIHVATTNIDAELWDRSNYDVPSIREKYAVPEGIPVITFVARLCRQKQPDVMASVLKTIRDRRVNFVCLVAGEGVYRGWLERFVRKHHLDEIKLLGAVQSEQVREILAISEVFFIPSENEGIALTLFEAMSMGVPLIAPDVGGQAELVSPDCGILIKPGPSQLVDYADALQLLLTDQALRTSMGAKSRERIRDDFTLRAMGGTIASLLDSAARNGKFDPGAATKKWDDTREMVYPEGSRSRLRGVAATTVLLLSPKNFSLKLRNLSLLGRIFLDPKKRIRLDDTFDARYYLSHHSDLRARGVAPLLHYSLQGYLEDRQPSPYFEASGNFHDHPEMSVNPLLWSILQVEE